MRSLSCHRIGRTKCQTNIVSNRTIRDIIPIDKNVKPEAEKVLLNAKQKKSWRWEQPVLCNLRESSSSKKEYINFMNKGHIRILTKVAMGTVNI